MRRGLLLLCVVAISGCDCGTPVTPDGGVDAGPVSMDAGSDAGMLDAGVVELGITLDEPFGAVLRGSSVQRQGHVTNLGARPVVVSGFSVGDAAFTLMAPTTTMLQPQGSLDFAVRFTAGAHGVVTSSLDFVADGAPQHFALSAESIGPLARVMPTSLDLGQVPLYGGTTATETAELAVENLGRDTMVHEPGTDLQVTFDVAQLDGDPATVCVNDCLPDALRVPVAMAVTTTLRVNASTPGPRRFEVRVFTNDPTQPLLTLEVRFDVVTRPLCQFQTTPVDFGVLNAGEARQLEVLLENVGTEACEITGALLEAEAPPTPAPVFELVTPQNFPIVLPPGGVQRSLVRATGQGMTSMQVTAPLKLEVNAPGRFASTVLTARLEQSAVVIGLTQPLEFGDVAVGCSSRAVPLSTNAQPLTVSTPSAAFQLTPSASGVPTVRFTPTAAGEVRDSLVVSWMSNGMPRTTTVELHGTGVTNAQRTETFATTAGQVDVLFAIDDTSSMTSRASTIQQQLGGLPMAFLPQGIDFHAAVLTCGDVADRGALRTTSTGARFVTGSVPMVSTRWSELLTVTGSTTGHACKDNVLRALTYPKVNTVNAGFRRAGVPLVVVHLTDTDDTDQALSPQVLELARLSSFSWNAIAPTSGMGQLTVTAPSGGVRTDLAAMDWSPSLAGIVTAAQTRARFALQSKPDAQPVVVRIDGTPVPAMSGANTVWSYDAASNAIVFTPTFAPMTSSSVSVSFTATCAP